MRRLIQSSLDATEALTKCLMSATRTPTGDEQSEAENNSIKTFIASHDDCSPKGKGFSVLQRCNTIEMFLAQPLLQENQQSYRPPCISKLQKIAASE
jgi:hypothetical protein